MSRNVFLITGTRKGIGRYLAEYYSISDTNNIVIGCSRSRTDLRLDNYVHYSIDITEEKEILGLFKEIKNNYKRLDVLINNAAINPSILSAALLSKDNIQKAYELNVFAPMIITREALKLMIRNKYGRIINLGSMATKHEVPGEALYTSTKASIVAYTRVVAKEVAKLNITANVLAPSAIPTDLSMQINQDALQEVLSRNAFHDYGKMEDVSNAINFLMARNSKAITGQLIYLGGV